MNRSPSFVMKLQLLILLLISGSTLQSQSLCGFDGIGVPSLTSFSDQQKLDATRYLHNAKHTGTVDTLEVVFHLLHQGEPQGTGTNISDAQLESAITALNRDFQRLPIHDSIAINPYSDDMHLHFRRACTDPQGNPSNGVVRVDLSSTPNYSTDGIILLPGSSGNFRAITRQSYWPTDRYVNVWVTHRIEVSGGLISGGAVPHVHPFFSDSTGGVYMRPIALGCDPDGSAGYNLQNPYGKLISHEVGHYLGLYHTFQGGSCTEANCTTQGDLVCDTEPHDNSLPYPQDTTCLEFTECIVSREPVENIMNYAAQTCGHAFTTGQGVRMQAYISQYLTTLLNPGCIIVGSEPIKEQYGLKVYPNPTSREFRIMAPDEGTLEVCDMAGRVIKIQNTGQNAGSEILIDCSSWPNGLYIIYWKTERGVAHQQLVVSR